MVDYDDDDDGLIDIRTLAQLDAVRHDLDGDGDPAAADAADYRAGYPNRDGSSAGRMGCELTDHDSNADTADQATCTGYELRNDLNFDTDGDGSTHTGGTGDMQDDYYNAGMGWEPIGSTSTSASLSELFATTFRGNGFVIDNLFINRTPGNNHSLGMFGEIDSTARIETLGVTNAFVGTNANFIGILAGANSGVIIGCYVTGKVQNLASPAGGMVGYINSHIPASGPSVGAIIASYSTAEVELTAASAITTRGLLVGSSQGGSIFVQLRHRPLARRRRPRGVSWQRCYHRWYPGGCDHGELLGPPNYGHHRRQDHRRVAEPRRLHRHLPELEPQPGR